MIHPSSFRDKSGYVYTAEGEIYRSVRNLYKENYDFFINSGLYEKLVAENLIIPHIEINNFSLSDSEIYKVLKPERIKMVSYPYEWCFSQLKDAAIVTLKIQEIALNYGMILKDASAFNIQFFNGKPILIDSLSFEKYYPDTPWKAYRQFCEHFIAPLALMSFVDVKLLSLFLKNIDGIPLEIAANTLPFRLKFKAGLFIHIFLHSRFKKKYFLKKITLSNKRISLKSQLGLVYSLKNTVKSIKLKTIRKDWEWSKYYENIDERYFDSKKKIVCDFLKKINPANILDIGANTGRYCFIDKTGDFFMISIDSDHNCIENLYNFFKKK